MIGIKHRWTKIGRLLAPSPSIPWMSTWTGASFAAPLGRGLFRVYTTGRDRQNRSQIGAFVLSLSGRPKIVSVSRKPVLSFGELGAFDENGVSYPSFLKSGQKTYLYYVGWSPARLVPFHNHLGLAVAQGGGSFRRVSRAPVLERTHEDFLSTGSCDVKKEGKLWRMWYTAWTQWVPAPKKPRHKYLLKYAESRDGIHWRRRTRPVIGFKNKKEYAISRPTVLKWGGRYHMWFCARGTEYRIGYAYSENGREWTRRDDLSGIAPSASGWDSRSQCYPHVFRHKDALYMLYNGNDYGRGGLGLAKLEL